MVVKDYDLAISPVLWTHRSRTFLMMLVEDKHRFHYRLSGGQGMLEKLM